MLSMTVVVKKNDDFGLLVCTQVTPILNFTKYIDSKMNWLDFHSKCLKSVYDFAKQLLFSRIFYLLQNFTQMS